MSNNFIASVRAAGPSDNFSSIVKIANALEIGNAIEVADEASRPTPSLSIQGLIYFAKTENTYWAINNAGDGWTQFDSGGGGGLNNVVEDLTPQLGGNLDTQTFTVDGRDVGTDGTKLDGVEASATVDQTDAEIETAYNAQVGAMSQATAEAGTSTTIERVTAERIKQAILKLAPVEIGLAISDETTDLTTGTAKLTFRMPYAMTLTSVRANVNTAPTGLLTVDINESGTSILSTKLTIDSTEKTSETAATAPVISDSALADDAEMTIDIDGTTAGKGLKIWLIGTRA